MWQYGENAEKIQDSDTFWKWHIIHFVKWQTLTETNCNNDKNNNGFVFPSNCQMIKDSIHTLHTALKSITQKNLKSTIQPYFECTLNAYKLNAKAFSFSLWDTHYTHTHTVFPLLLMFDALCTMCNVRGIHCLSKRNGKIISFKCTQLWYLIVLYRILFCNIYCIMFQPAMSDERHLQPYLPLRLIHRGSSYRHYDNVMHEDCIILLLFAAFPRVFHAYCICDGGWCGK